MLQFILSTTRHKIHRDARSSPSTEEGTRKPLHVQKEVGPVMEAVERKQFHSRKCDLEGSKCHEHKKLASYKSNSAEMRFMRVIISYIQLDHTCNVGTWRKTETNICKRREDGKRLCLKNIRWISLKENKVILWGHHTLWDCMSSFSAIEEIALFWLVPVSRSCRRWSSKLSAA